MSSSVLMKKVVGTWLDGPLLPKPEASTKLDFRDRGLFEGGASPPGSGRMLGSSGGGRSSQRVLRAWRCAELRER